MGRERQSELKKLTIQSKEIVDLQNVLALLRRLLLVVSSAKVCDGWQHDKLGGFQGDMLSL